MNSASPLKHRKFLFEAQRLTKRLTLFQNEGARFRGWVTRLRPDNCNRHLSKGPSKPAFFVPGPSGRFGAGVAF
jgi:hypothetical protein